MDLKAGYEPLLWLDIAEIKPWILQSIKAVPKKMAWWSGFSATSWRSNSRWLNAGCVTWWEKEPIAVKVYQSDLDVDAWFGDHRWGRYETIGPWHHRFLVNFNKLKAEFNTKCLIRLIAVTAVVWKCRKVMVYSKQETWGFVCVQPSVIPTRNTLIGLV